MRKNFYYFVSTILVPSFLIYSLIFYNNKNGIFEGVDDIEFEEIEEKNTQSEPDNLSIENQDIFSMNDETANNSNLDNISLNNEYENNYVDTLTIPAQEEVITMANNEPLPVNDDVPSQSKEKQLLSDESTVDNTIVTQIETKPVEQISSKPVEQIQNIPVENNQETTPISTIEMNSEEEINPDEENIPIYTTEELINGVLELVNNERIINGIQPLTLDYTLNQIAEIRSKEIVTSWSHTRPNGTKWNTLYDQFGLYGSFGENLAYGQTDHLEVFNAWMNSPSHKSNMLSAKFNKIGIAVYNYNGVYYWAQEFSS